MGRNRHCFSLAFSCRVCFFQLLGGCGRGFHTMWVAAGWSLSHTALHQAGKGQAVGCGDAAAACTD